MKTTRDIALQIKSGFLVDSVLALLLIQYLISCVKFNGTKVMVF